MNSILTNSIEANSFLGLVQNTQKKNGIKTFARRQMAKVESTEVLTNLAVATIVIVMGLAAGSVSQQKIEQARFVAPVVTEVAV
ncbi:hypothetical protein [Paremcibacter congregatus]|uniref:Uncharacterized protein n=1 Tax=Paremcibacter congregatus TaxID=2043170 RepID=A0A2G4YLT8_9PROT|nr:hypothetical protein [Paremcibacter congregatus]PHZ83285.1 hypothetical protein CRD36_17110 [Paremcibacter congregatus]QDE28241.1 hypothetical protein FIV45_13675 [Paremcibacter congregatus]